MIHKVLSKKIGMQKTRRFTTLRPSNLISSSKCDFKQNSSSDVDTHRKSLSVLNLLIFSAKPLYNLSRKVDAKMSLLPIDKS